jgi:hypothetical protein
MTTAAPLIETADQSRFVVQIADDLETLIAIHNSAWRAYENACGAREPLESAHFAARRAAPEGKHVAKSKALRAAERREAKLGEIEIASQKPLLAYRPKTIQEMRRKANYIASIPLIWECATQEEFCALIMSMTSLHA